MDDIKEKIKQALRHIWTNKYRLFLCLLTLCCLFGLVHYFKSADSATASISFNYSEASLGMNPNKTRFNAYEIVSDEVMERAIEPETFRFSPAVRAEMRARYVLEDRVVLGHVGRFDVRKNHERLLEIFAAFLQLEPRAMLVLIGTGRLEQAVRAQAQELGITDHILFAGLQSNVADWYQMMDLFVMPSRFEGLPVVGIEAQAAGLGCVFSDAVPAEVLLSSHAIQIPLSASNADWAAGLQRMLHQPCDRSAGAELIRQAGYDINIAAARLQQQYLQLGGQA